MRKKPIRTTEGRNRRSRGIDTLSTVAILRIINREDASVAGEVRREIPAIARAVDAAVRGIKAGGRIIYIGAGTSGRLAVLDASEIPPTFGVSPNIVQAVIAGGPKALTSAIEGAEDSAAQGARDLRAKKIRGQDVVVGIAASGRTPYVLGALEYAKRRRATTIAITSNRGSALARAAGIAIVVQTGPEVVTGSTRMKAGTAQKLVLNMLSTAAMVRLGHLYDNWMIDVAQTNAKLRERGLRIAAEASGASESAAARAMRQADHNLRVALVMLKRDCSAEDALAQLRAVKNNLRRALGD